MIFVLAVVSVGFTAEGVSAAELTVAYTANTSGKLLGCGCPGDQYGGLVERATLIKRLRKKEKRMLLLDAGNMVSLFGDFDARAARVIRLMNLMGYDAAGIGRQELFANLSAVAKMRAVSRFPLVSATVARNGSALPVFPPSAIVRVGNAVVGIVGVGDSSAGYFPELDRKTDYAMLPAGNLRTLFDSLARRTDFIVVLAQTEPGTGERLLRMFPAIDLVIDGFGSQEMEAPKAAGRGFLVAPGGRGQFVGLVTLTKKPGAAAVVRRSELIPVIGLPEDRTAAAIAGEHFGTRR